MLDILTTIIDAIFPPAEAVKRLRSVKPEDFKHCYCLHQIGSWQSLSRYQNKLVQAAITANKFHDSRPAAKLLASLIDVWLDAQPNKPTILVPIPLSSERQKKRGYNQVENILAAVTHPDVTTLKLLKKIRHTAPQTTLARKERLTNLKKAFMYVDVKAPLQGSRIVIVDDVITTGATVNEARATLALHLPPDCELVCLGVAH
jgi:ComF family protein